MEKFMGGVIDIINNCISVYNQCSLRNKMKKYASKAMKILSSWNADDATKKRIEEQIMDMTDRCAIIAFECIMDLFDVDEIEATRHFIWNRCMPCDIRDISDGGVILFMLKKAEELKKDGKVDDKYCDELKYLVYIHKGACHKGTRVST